MKAKNLKKNLDVDAVMGYLVNRQSMMECFIERAISVGFDESDTRLKIIVEFLRGRNFGKAEELSDGVA